MNLENKPSELRTKSQWKVLDLWTNLDENLWIVDKCRSRWLLHKDVGGLDEDEKEKKIEFRNFLKAKFDKVDAKPQGPQDISEFSDMMTEQPKKEELIRSKNHWKNVHLFD